MEDKGGKRVKVYPVLAAMVLPIGIVGLAGVNLLRVLVVCHTDGQGLPALAAFDKPCKQADFPGVPRTLAGF